MRYARRMLTDVPHGTDEDGEHDPDACYRCLAEQEPVRSDCRCGECCRSLILEATAEDGVVEPQIKERCSPLYEHPQLTGGTRQLIGYILNAEDGPCTFLDQQTNLCKIYQTRPLMCRLFDCSGKDRDNLVELGILPPRG
jgi:Fe-S-cluster containining protein